MARSPDPQKPWEHRLPETDLALFYKAGFGRPVGIGRQPAVLVIDVNHNFCGDRPQNISESVETWRASCGEVAWDCIHVISRLLGAARPNNLPVIYTTGVSLTADQQWRAGRGADKNSRKMEAVDDLRAGHTIISEIAPGPGDLVVEKEKPSAFFGTSLHSNLVELGVDSLIVCGTTTSGCVRSTVVDAFSLNYRVTVVADATFDRSQIVHDMNMFDMDQKYADVLPLDAILSGLTSRVTSETTRS